MCALAGSMCESFVDERGGPAAVPDEPPVLAGTRVIPGTSSGDSGTVGGMLLVLCGTDGLQRPYRTEMLGAGRRRDRHHLHPLRGQLRAGGLPEEPPL
jgi:hypothetical protein